MKRFLLSLALAMTTAFPAFAQAIPLSQLSGYLNTLRSAEGDFTQINADGSISTGTLYLQRPGRVRFEYGGGDDDLLVIAGGGQVAIFDARSNARPEQYPLRRTPLHLILARNVDLGRSGMVIGHNSDGTSTRVVAQDPERPEIGQITLVFTGDPVELRQWIITDEAGSDTTVILGDLDTDARVGARLFNIPQEIRARGLDD
ncbi:outer membrane lipoprotein carrier protein LolA [Rhodophyticola sp. CCM32]|uniref:LolA family protein n=1 Tax=Rhodophyticola sp. CCM32 TaxID=2916397 RepID=UPI00107F632D|nr:outer membrane lipoprotein carrier protein LolA [Rhodophyticola sp. CCM32]QBY01849.1 outer membrane lipoprotein carrier protein LolA [Rhodophyticola sp. CCM32]